MKTKFILNNFISFYKMIFIFLFLTIIYSCGSNNSKKHINKNEINTIEAVESNVIISDLENVYNLQFSPTNNFFAFTNEDMNSIYLFDIKQKKLNKLTDDLGSGYKFSWSSDGNMICYRRTYFDINNKKQQIKIINIEGNEIFSITDENNSLSTPVWIENNKTKKIAYFDENGLNFSEEFINSNNNAKIESINVLYDHFTSSIKIINNDGKVKVITKEAKGFDPYISPNQEFVVYSTLSGLEIYNLVNDSVINIGDGIYPCWSKDSKKIVYQRYEDNGEIVTSSDIYIINNDGSQKKNLTNTKSELETFPFWNYENNQIFYTIQNKKGIYYKNL